MDQNEHINWNSLEEVDNSRIAIELELTTKCTLGCIACPRNGSWKDRSVWNTGMMDKNIAMNIIKNTNYSNYNFVGAYGDCIYHPDFHEIIECALTADKFIMVETNGSHRNEEWWEETANLSWNNKANFRFSIDGLEDTNHIYRMNSNWDSIITGVRMMTSLSEERRPIISWKYLVFPYNEHQVEEARQLAQELGMRFYPVKSLRNYTEKWFRDDEHRRQIDWSFA